MKTSLFSKYRLTEFVRDISRNCTKICITVNAEGIEAVVFPLFMDTALVLHEGDCIEFGKERSEVIPAIPTMTVRKDK